MPRHIHPNITALQATKAGDDRVLTQTASVKTKIETVFDYLKEQLHLVTSFPRSAHATPFTIRESYLVTSR